MSLDRFIKAHKEDYARALKEIKNGRKRTHWMWYIFPQITGLEISKTTKYYEIKSLDEANAYLDNELLNAHLIEISNALLKLNTNNPVEVFGDVDALKLKSSMTLFNYISDNKIFDEIIDKFFNGNKDLNTIKICNEMYCEQKGYGEEAFNFLKMVVDDENMSFYKHEKRQKLVHECINNNFNIIMKTVANYYHITVDELKGKIRTDYMRHIRRIAIYLCRTYTDAYVPRIAQEFYGLDSYLVLYIYEKVCNDIKEEKNLIMTDEIKSRNLEYGKILKLEIDDIVKQIPFDEFLEI